MTDDSRAAFAASAMRLSAWSSCGRVQRRTCRANSILLLEEQRRAHRLQRIVETLTGVDIASDLVKFQEIALRYQDDRLGAFAGGDGPAEIGDGGLRPAFGCGFGDPFERQIGGVADDAFDLVDRDRRLAKAVERQLLDLGAR